MTTTTTLEEAISVVEGALATGEMINCPCCGQTVKMYGRTIHATMWQSLLIIYAAEAEGINAKDIGQKLTGTDCRDYPILRFWNLIEQDDGTKHWHITLEGQEFIEGKTKIPKYVYIYNTRPHHFSEELMDASQCQRKFSLAETLAA